MLHLNAVGASLVVVATLSCGCLLHLPAVAVAVASWCLSVQPASSVHPGTEG